AELRSQVRAEAGASARGSAWEHLRTKGKELQMPQSQSDIERQAFQSSPVHESRSSRTGAQVFLPPGCACGYRDFSGVSECAAGRGDTPAGGADGAELRDGAGESRDPCAAGQSQGCAGCGVSVFLGDG